MQLWCDRRNQARARAAKGKAQQRLTGNIGQPIQLKDLDLRILSIIGGESSVDLPVIEVDVGKQPEVRCFLYKILYIIFYKMWYVYIYIQTIQFLS